MGAKLKVNFIRYADDFIVTAANRETLKDIILPAIIEFLNERGLEIQKEKTKITHIDDGFDFLGQNIRKYKGKLLIKPNSKSIKAIKAKIFEIIKRCNGFPAKILINLLNPAIRGWANYHRHVVSKEVFSKIDNDIFIALWRWAKRQHNHYKNHTWVRNKYFKTFDNKNWVFTATQGKKTYKLFKMESIPIKRHVKIRASANPYDPEWQQYFSKRDRSNRMRK